MRRGASSPGQRPVPVQPVQKPILCSPYDEPTAHWVYDTSTGEALRTDGRRPASYWFKTERTGGSQLLFTEEERDDLPLVNALREDVRHWRRSGYANATRVTRELLKHWNDGERARRLFFCQREAVETILYLNEILASDRRTQWTPALDREAYARLMRGEPSPLLSKPIVASFPRLIDRPADAALPPLIRYGCKMATGSGKTVVMAMLIAWAFCNRGRNPGDERFPSSALVVCPNLTIRERLQVLRPEDEESYYAAFDLVPASLMPELMKGKVLVTNWHRFAPEGDHVEGGKSFAVVDKGPESPEAFARRVLGDLYERAPLMVLNDEGHHAYRPAPLEERERVTAEEKADREEATVWISGLDRINGACGVKFAVDLSATPFYLQGSGYTEGSPFPWLVSDFGLVDAIESGIVKIPRLPVSDTTGQPLPKYFALWRSITDGLQPGEKLPGGKPKPEVVWMKGEDALRTLASQWKERFTYFQESTPGQERTPPVMIVVCDNTDIAQLIYQSISGEQVSELAPEDIEPEDDEDDEAPARRKKSKPKVKITYDAGKLFPEFSNRDGLRTLRIDSKLLSQAESDEPNTNKIEAAQALRMVLDTVGKPGKPGEQVRCVVAVQMLNEGWDANNVTHILGLRAFGSQLLCEQVIGRGLRRMDYDPDPETGLLREEYVDIYGIPFSLIPFKGRETHKPEPDDKPVQHVRALPERKAFEIRFPVVEGYAFALRRNSIKAEVGRMEPLVLEPDRHPTAVFVKPQVGYQVGSHGGAGFETKEQNRRAFYESTHPQTIRFEIARQITRNLAEGAGNGKARLGLQSRHQLFPQVYRLVEEYVRRKVDFRGEHPCELGLKIYAKRVVERLMAAIEPDEEAGETPILPILNRYRPIGSTSDVSFKTKRPCFLTTKSHINQVVSDTASWEQSAAFRLEQAPHVRFYARNDHLELTIPYEYEGMSHAYVPDFIVRLQNGATAIVEIKGHEDDQDRAKHQAASRWISAVNHWGELGRWEFLVCKDPQRLGMDLRPYAGA